MEKKKFVTFTRKTAQYVKIYNSPPVKLLNKSLHSLHSWYADY